MPLSFEKFLEGKGEAINLMFEERLFGRFELLHKVADMLASERIPYEVVGGMAVNIQIERVDPDEMMVTRDVDIMVSRADIARIQEAAPRHGFEFRHTAGLDMLLYGGEKKAARGVHLIFSGEKVGPDQMENPTLAPEEITVYDKEIPVIRVADLVRMKLNAFRDKDRVHVRAMDSVGLITAEVEDKLPTALRDRLRHVRATL